MKFNKISTLIFILFIIYCNAHNLKSELENNKNENHAQEYKTFLVKTNMAKEELQALLQEGETKLVNLKKNRTHENNSTIIKEINNVTNLTIDGNLEEKIIQEIREDALHPIDEFHVNQNEVKTFFNKPKTRFIDSLYEKKFGKFYVYLTLFLFVMVMMYYKDIIFNQKNVNIKKAYANYYDLNNEKEYILLKNN